MNESTHVTAASPDLRSVGRLRVAQLAGLLVFGAALVLVTLFAWRGFTSAADAHRRDSEVANTLTMLRDQATVVQRDYWRYQVEEGGGIPPNLISTITRFGDIARTQAEEERRRDPNSPAARAAATAISSLDAVLALAPSLFAARDQEARNAVMARAFRGPVPAHVNALSRWADLAVQRSGDSMDAQASRVRWLATWLGTLVAVLLGFGIAIYLLLGRVRTHLAREFADAAAEEAALRRVATTVAESDDLETVFQTIADEVVTLLGVEAGWLDRCEHDHATTVASRAPQAWVDAVAHLGADPRVVIQPDSVRGRALRTGVPARVADYRATSGVMPQFMIELGVRSSVAAPVFVDGRVWGVVVAVASDPAALPEGCEERLVPFARLAGVAIANAKARALLAERASTDALTLLPNHGAFHGRLGEEVASAMSDGRALGLVMMDIDHFKAINDTFGHPVGDRVLTEVARRLQSLIRSGELLARTGGEEFAWLLPGSDREGAFAAAERAREAIRGEPFPEVGMVTISAGVCGLERARDAHDLLAKADAALLVSKDSGRDRTRAFDAHKSDDATDVLGGPDRFDSLRAFDALGAVARAVDSRHPRTLNHSTRVARLSEQIALALHWGPDEARCLAQAASLHDVGRMGAADDIAPHEAAELSARLTTDTLSLEQSEWIRLCAADMGTPVPEGARIIAVANAWDELAHGTATAPEHDTATAHEMLRAMRDTQLDARVVDTLESVVHAEPPPRTVTL